MVGGNIKPVETALNIKNGGSSSNSRKVLVPENREPFEIEKFERGLYPGVDANRLKKKKTQAAFDHIGDQRLQLRQVIEHGWTETTRRKNDNKVSYGSWVVVLDW